MKSCISKLCTTPCTHVSHYQQKRSFCVFYTGHDRPKGRLVAAKNVLLYTSRHILSQGTPQGGYHRGNFTKMAEKCINCISARPTPPHTNPMGSAPENTFSAQNIKNQKIDENSYPVLPPSGGGGGVCPGRSGHLKLDAALMKVGPLRRCLWSTCERHAHRSALAHRCVWCAQGNFSTRKASVMSVLLEANRECKQTLLLEVSARVLLGLGQTGRGVQGTERPGDRGSAPVLCYGGRVQLSSETSQAGLWQWPSTGALLTKGLGQGCIGRGRRLPPPLQGAYA